MHTTQTDATAYKRPNGYLSKHAGGKLQSHLLVIKRNAQLSPITEALDSMLQLSTCDY